MIREIEAKKRFCLEDEFRDRLFKKAYKNAGSLGQLGKKLGYTGPSPNYYVNRMWRGEQPITRHRLEILSKMTRIPMTEILQHSMQASNSQKKV